MTQIVVTGGSGKAGRAVVRDLVEHGYDVVNVDVVPAEPRDAPFLRADLTDLGETIEALRGADAVVHLAAIPAPRIRTVERTFEINILSTYNVFSAAALLGLRAGRLGLERDRARPAVRSPSCPEPPRPGGRSRASPRTGLRADRRGAPAAAAFELLAVQGPRRGDGSPVRALERDPVRRSSLLRDPRARRLRVVPRRLARPASGRMERLWATSTPATSARPVAWRLTAEIDGAEVFIIAAADTVMDRPNAELVAACFPSVPLRPGTGDFDTLLSIDKARRVLGYDPGLFVARRRPGARSAPDRAAPRRA